MNLNVYISIADKLCLSDNVNIRVQINIFCNDN